MAHPTYQYIFEDTLTGVKLATIPLYGVVMKRYLNTWGQSSSYGTFTGTFRADTPGFDVRELLGATVPGKTNVWVQRDDTLIWGGQVTTRTYQSESYTYQLNGTTFDAFMQGQFAVTDQAPFADDPRNLINSLWGSLAITSSTNLRLALPGHQTAQAPLYTYSWTGTDYDPKSDIIGAAVQAGAEYRLDYSYDENGIRTCTMVLGRWDQQDQVGVFTVGSPPSDSSVTFRYPGAISNYWMSESGPQGATEVLGIGASNGATTPRGILVNNDYIAMGWPLYGIKFNWSNVSDQTTLNNMLAQQLDLFKPPFLTPTYKLNGSKEFGSFDLGDYLHIVIDDPFRFPDGPFKQDIRVVAMELTPASDDGVEQADFTVDQPSTTG